jgi:hypothetical protein
MGETYKHGWLHSVLTACLILLVSFSSIAPLLAKVFESPSTGMACCKTKKMNGCCPKSHGASAEPGFSAATCKSNCAQITLGGTTALSYADGQPSGLRPPVNETGRAHFRELSGQSFLSTNSLLQRPPPSLV